MKPKHSSPNANSSLLPAPDIPWLMSPTLCPKNFGPPLTSPSPSKSSPRAVTSSSTARPSTSSTASTNPYPPPPSEKPSRLANPLVNSSTPPSPTTSKKPSSTKTTLDLRWKQQTSKTCNRSQRHPLIPRVLSSECLSSRPLRPLLRPLRSKAFFLTLRDPSKRGRRNLAFLCNRNHRKQKRR